MANKSKFIEFIALALLESSEGEDEHEFGFIPNWQAQEINQQTGVKLNNTVKIITFSGIRHTIKEHGNEKSERERGQKGITKEDIDLIPQIVANFDIVEKGNTKRGAPGVLFRKVINSTEYFVAMTVRHRKGDTRLEFSTMYAKPQKKADV